MVVSAMSMESHSHDPSACQARGSIDATSNHRDDVRVELCRASLRTVKDLSRCTRRSRMFVFITSQALAERSHLRSFRRRAERPSIPLLFLTSRFSGCHSAARLLVPAYLTRSRDSELPYNPVVVFGWRYVFQLPQPETTLADACGVTIQFLSIDTSMLNSMIPESKSATSVGFRVLVKSPMGNFKFDSSFGLPIHRPAGPSLPSTRTSICSVDSPFGTQHRNNL